MRYYILILFFVSVTLAQIPKPIGYINDFAGIITNDAVLAGKISDLKQSTGAEISIVTVSALPVDESIQTYSNKIFNGWGIGKKGEDNGLLILITVEERRIQVETGYGLEGILPDGRIGRILDAHLEELSSENYDTALEGITDDFSEIIRNEYVEGNVSKKQNIGGIFPYVLFSMIGLLLIIALTYNRLGNRCPKCKSGLKKEVISKTRTSQKIKIYCLQCGYHKYVTVAVAAGMMGVGGGRSGGSGGGFGGGSSGGGGAGRGF